MPASAEQGSSEKSVKFLKLTELGLDPKTVQILKKRIFLPENPTKVQVEQVVTSLSALIFPGEEVNHGWVLDQCMRDVVKLSFFITTPEGKRFQTAYEYLHRLIGTLFAHAPGKFGNVFMLYGGKRYVQQFPNEYHMKFVQQLLTKPKDEETWDIEFFGGSLGQEYVTSARDYYLDLGDLTEALSPTGMAIAAQAAAYGVPTGSGLFLQRISPDGVMTLNPTQKIAQIYLDRKEEVRASLFAAASLVSNPGLILEYLLEYLESDDNYNYDGHRILENIALLRNVADDQFHFYQQLLLAKVNELVLDKRSVPEIVMREIQYQPRGSR
jgi:hypothetical protein